MQVSTSGFYAWMRRPTGVDAQRLILQQTVKALQKAKRGSLGSRRMSHELKRKGYDVGRYSARSLMREANAPSLQRKRFRATTDSNHGFPVAPNILNREFNVTELNRVWVADITPIWTFEGWLYLAGILDLCDRQLVGWAMADHMRTELALDALKMAVGRRQPAAGLIHHNDRGSQYASREYRTALDDLEFRASMSRKGNCWDNAVMERFFGSLKSEWCNAQTYLTRSQARQDVVEYIEMEYNSNRLHSTLGYNTPREHELQVAA